jgi:glycine cleavage system aminomethyltransferase T
VGTIPADTLPIKKTALHSIHQQLGARMTRFAGWEMPVQYSGKATSGSPALFIKKNIGFAYLLEEYRSTGTEFGIIIREKEVRAQVVPIPFYRGMRQNGKP